ncbi:Mono/diheme cytochrome c family protein OS=Castellaniella defragrans OX=75697 GN=HNR28_000927 PE=4 SV=1 [Castellaniella defragrans]
MKRTTHMQSGRLLALAALAVLALCLGQGTRAAEPSSPDLRLIQKGEYLATAGDCMACHTAHGGKPFAGGLAVATPIGNIFSTNITPSKTAGIGNYTLEQFTRAVRQGVRANGQHLYPAMPYTSYAKTSDADIQAMYAYFMHGVAPVDTAAPKTSLPFPFDIRLAMIGWNFLFLDDKPYHPVADKGTLWNRGAYLVHGLAHCAVCHTPRNTLMAEDSSQFLGGAYVGPWYAPNITSDMNSGIGDWSDAELVQYLSTGHTAKAQASGPMMEAIDFSLRHLTKADLQAIAAYLKTVPAIHDPADDAKPVSSWGKASDELDTVRGHPWPENQDLMTGPQLYDAHCASCHQAQAQGSFGGGLPALFHNTATGRLQTNNLVLAILDGIDLPAQGNDVIMPGFREVMSDTQVATLGNYLMKAYGNPAGEVTVDQVTALRSGTPIGPDTGARLLLAARVGMVVAGLILLFILYAIFRPRRHRAPRARRARTST